MRSAPDYVPLEFTVPDAPASIINAMREHQAMLDAIRNGLINKVRAECPADPQQRSEHLKSFAYFCDASMVGVCELRDAALLREPTRNLDIDRLANDLRTRQTKTLASGIDLIMADLRDSMSAPPTSVEAHSHALVFLYEYPRDPTDTEPGTEWIIDAQAHRACLLSSETAIVLANYLRLLGFDASAHTGTSSDVNLNQLAVDAGLASVEESGLHNPYLGNRFGIAAVTTTFAMLSDAPLVSSSEQSRFKMHGPAWWVGKGSARNALNRVRYASRRYVDGEQAFETLKRVEQPTTYIDEARVARVPKRADMFARATFGDMGKRVQQSAAGGHYARKAAPSMAQRRALGAFVLLQNAEAAETRVELDPVAASELIKATCYFLGADAVGISRCPEWTWYSHDATGEVLEPPHQHAISMIIDQGYETMEGSSGDDWIAVSQSMRAYLRFSLLGGVIAKQLGNLGYSAKAHTVLDGEVLQPPLLLLSGLGEVSRIGEVILNPFLGPRLKSGAVTTDMPLAHDKPIDFGLQRFCESCNKCARECPSGAITAGPKLMFNGYEIWKSDSQKCASYRITTEGGAMCGRCMKTCPWNLEGVFKERPFRWAAMNWPKAAPWLARIDDAVGNGSLNPVKKWWWDLEISEDGGYRPTTHAVNERTLQRDLHLKYKDQTLAVYPADIAPHPYPYPFAMDREAGIRAYQKLIPAHEYRRRIATATSDDLPFVHRYTAAGDSPVISVVLSRVQKMTDAISVYEFRAPDGGELPRWEAGAHIDIVVAPEYLRPYSLCGNPVETDVYRIAVLREEQGRGGSALLHRIFQQGRRLFIGRPFNHFPLDEKAPFSLLLGGGIGITPLLTMAHRLHAIGADFAVRYSGRNRDEMAFLEQIESFPWSDRVSLHVSSEGSRARFKDVFAALNPAAHVYTCGSDAYMRAVMSVATDVGLPEDQCHLEYFSVPEAQVWVDQEFTVKLQKSDLEFQIPANKVITDVLLENGVKVDVKCSDGLCGVCRCGLIDGDVEHRDFVLSVAQRKNNIILCQSRAAEKDGVIVIDL